MAVVRYKWMFRSAAVVCLLLGGSWLWSATLSDRWAEIRPVLLVLGVMSLVTGILLFRRNKAAIATSAIGAAFLSICAAVAAPQMQGPGILALGLLAMVSGLYAALAARELFGHGA
jgi:hypothetical protein